MHRIRDDSGQLLELERIPERIVSLVPNVTELICALGAAPRLVAVTRYCVVPIEVVSRLPKVGGTKNPDVAAIRAHAPDIVIMNSEENRREDCERLRALGLPVFVATAESVYAAAKSIARIGALIGADARSLVRGVIEVCNDLAAWEVEPVRVFCPIWRNPWMGFNARTYAHDVLRHAGGANVCASAAERYPQIELEQIALLEPEVILLPSEPYRFDASHVKSLAALAGTPAWRNHRVHLVDGRALTWYGMRTAPALRYFWDLLQEETEPAV